MKIDTVQGCYYVLTCVTGCVVKAMRNDGKDPLVLLEVSSAGQYGFVAPTHAVEVTDEDALVTQSFKGAALGSSARDGGIQNGDDADLNYLTAQGATFARTVNANGGVNIPLDPVAAGDAVNLGNVPISLFMPGHPLVLLKSAWQCSGTVEDTACGIKFKDLTSGGFGGLCTRVMQWSDYASTATILTVITLTGGNGANVLIDAAYNPNVGVSITPVTSPDTAFLPGAVQLSLFETRQGDSITGRLVGVGGTVKTFSVPSQMDSHSCVYRIFLLETGGVIKAYLGKFQSGMFDGVGDVLARPEYLAETTVPNNPKRFCYLGVAGIPGGEGNSFPFRIPVISDVRRYYGPWLLNLFS